MLEAKWAFATHVEDICAVVEVAVKTIVRNTGAKGDADTEACAELVSMSVGDVNKPWKWMAYTVAMSRIT